MTFFGEGIHPQCMLDTWDVTIFEGIKQKLEDSAMKLVQDEREGAIINSALVIGVRESCGKFFFCLWTSGSSFWIKVLKLFLVNLSATSTTKAWNYVDHFEAAYIKSMENFYRPRTSQFIAQNGIQVSSRFVSYHFRKLNR